MAKASKAPTLAEIQSYIAAFRADPNKNRIADLEHSAMLSEMTHRIFAENIPDNARDVVWSFCKTLANYAHAPVTPAEYKRMQKYVDETAIIDVLLAALEKYFPSDEFGFDITGYYYSIALLSQTQYRREDCLALLDKTTQFCVKNKPDHKVLLRNMKVLEKNYPDLSQFRAVLETL